jgi:hypothetical protein
MGTIAEKARIVNEGCWGELEGTTSSSRSGDLRAFNNKNLRLCLCFPFRHWQDTRSRRPFFSRQIGPRVMTACRVTFLTSGNVQTGQRETTQEGQSQPLPRGPMSVARARVAETQVLTGNSSQRVTYSTLRPCCFLVPRDSNYPCQFQESRGSCITSYTCRQGRQ